jgi:DNA-directed RNA polymerase specialized sigma24 family protein
MTTPDSKIYFGFPGSGEPRDALHHATAVLDTLNALLVNCRDLHFFQDNDHAEPIFGLTILFDCVKHTIQAAAKDMDREERPGDFTVANRMRTTSMTPMPPPMPDLANSFKALLAEAVREGRLPEPPADAPASEGEEADGATYPRVMTARETVLAARETAIAAAAAKGHTVEEICQAVNMNKANVERILARLRDAGESPAEPLRSAVNA